jgi:Zn-finger nucleic acid-binding protein
MEWLRRGLVIYRLFAILKAGMQVNCPRDQYYLQKDFHDLIMIDACPRCSGMFLSIHELLNHFKIPDLEETLRQKIDETAPSPIKCPRCEVLRALSDSIDATMHPFMVTGVEIDICGNCLGIWFDGGELERIMPPVEFKKFNTAREAGVKDLEQTKILARARNQGIRALEGISKAVPKQGTVRKVEKKREAPAVAAPNVPAGNDPESAKKAPARPAVEADTSAGKKPVKKKTLSGDKKITAKQ